MIAEIIPSIPKGEIIAPPSKSFAHRCLISAFLSGKRCRIDNVSLSDDIKATIDCINALGADITYFDNSVIVDKGSLKNNILNCNESGSTLRFLIPYALTLNEKITFCGSKRLFARPLSAYREICENNGFLFELREDSLTVCGNLKSGEYKIKGDVSSQFITGLMFALPTLDNDSRIKIIPPYESKPYVNLTQDVLQKYGINTKISENVITIKGRQKYTACDLVIEGDYSNSAYFEALNFVGGNVCIKGLGKSFQGDSAYKEFFERLHNYCEIDVSDCPDLAPILFVAASLNQGAKFTGTHRLLYKESDRITAMQTELFKCGIELKVLENEVVVPQCNIIKNDIALDSHNDHRVFMALCVLLCKIGGKIADAEAVNKSMPDFFDKMKELNVKIRLS